MDSTTFESFVKYLNVILTQLSVDERIERLSRLHVCPRIDSLILQDDMDARAEWIIHYEGLKPYFDMLNQESLKLLTIWTCENRIQAEIERCQRSFVEIDTKILGQKWARRNGVNMLCALAHNFPLRVAELLERDRQLTRNFREETVTDLLMASLVGLEPFGVSVQFPYEPTTGGDMDWIYVAPLDLKGGRYLRLILQAKRAQHQKLKKAEYWYYSQLDHDKGNQAQTLCSFAATEPGRMETLPLYIFYHPASALSNATSRDPAVEGINIVFADKIAPVVKGGCGRKEKRISFWRSAFLPLSDLLCWPVIVSPPAPPSPETMQLLSGPSITGGYHPDLVATRLRNRRLRTDATGLRDIEAADGIPDDLQRAINGSSTLEDRKRLKRPRVIFTTSLTREDIGSSDLRD